METIILIDFDLILIDLILIDLLLNGRIKSKWLIAPWTYSLSLTYT